MSTRFHCAHILGGPAPELDMAIVPLPLNVKKSVFELAVVDLRFFSIRPRLRIMRAKFSGVHRGHCTQPAISFQSRQSNVEASYSAKRSIFFPNLFEAGWANEEQGLPV